MNAKTPKAAPATSKAPAKPVPAPKGGGKKGKC